MLISDILPTISTIYYVCHFHMFDFVLGNIKCEITFVLHWFIVEKLLKFIGRTRNYTKKSKNFVCIIWYIVKLLKLHNYIYVKNFSIAWISKWVAEKCWHNQKWPLVDGKKTYWLKPDDHNNEIICSIKWNCVAALIEGFYSLSWSKRLCSGISSQSFEDCIPYECILKDENWHLLSSKFYLWKHNQILYLCTHSVYLLLLDQKVITCLKFNNSSGQSKFLSLIFKFLQTSYDIRERKKGMVEKAIPLSCL